VIRLDCALPRLAVASALAASLVLAGCGRKAGLDPPPTASVAPTTTIDGQPAPAAQPDGTTPPPKRRFILDWLLD
jgi:predicted small lipoprotein YifL